MSSEQATPTMTKKMSSIYAASSATANMPLGMFIKSSSMVHPAPSSAHIFSQIGFCRTYCVSTATSRPSRASATQVIGTPVSISIDHPSATHAMQMAAASSVKGTSAGKSGSAMHVSPSSIAASHSAPMAASTLQALISAPAASMAASASSSESAMAPEASRLHAMTMSAARSAYCSIYCSPPAMKASTAAPVGKFCLFIMTTVKP